MTENEALAKQIGDAVEEAMNRSLLDFERRLAMIISSSGRQQSPGVVSAGFTEYARKTFSPAELAEIGGTARGEVSESEKDRLMREMAADVRSILDVLTARPGGG